MKGTTVLSGIAVVFLQPICTSSRASRRLVRRVAARQHPKPSTFCRKAGPHRGLGRADACCRPGSQTLSEELPSRWLLSSRSYSSNGLLWGGPTALEAAPPWLRSSCCRIQRRRRARDRRCQGPRSGTTQLNGPSGRVSVGQCLEHLCSPATSPAGDIGRPPGRSSAVVQDITPGWFGRWFIRNYIEPSARRDGARPEKEPSHGTVDSGILARSSAATTGRQIISRARRHDVNRIRSRIRSCR